MGQLPSKLTKDFDRAPDARDEERQVEHEAERLQLGEEVEGAVGQQLDDGRGQDDGAAHNLQGSGGTQRSSDAN